MSDHMRQFEEAFASSGAGARRICVCGRQFYNADEGAWDWEEGELEKLCADPSATGVEWSCGTLVIEGISYARDCDCWHKAASSAIDFIEDHAHAIASYLNTRKADALADAKRMPTVKEKRGAPMHVESKARVEVLRVVRIDDETEYDRLDRLETRMQDLEQQKLKEDLTGRGR